MRGGGVVGLFGMGEESFWNTLGKWVGGAGELGEVEYNDYRKIELWLPEEWNMTTGRLNNQIE